MIFWRQQKHLRKKSQEGIHLQHLHALQRICRRMFNIFEYFFSQLVLVHKTIYARALAQEKGCTFEAVTFEIGYQP